MYTFYPIANYENYLLTIRDVLSNVLFDAPVPPDSFQILAYTTEGLGKYIQDHIDIFTKPKPYAFVTLNQQPVVEDTQSYSIKWLRNLVTTYLGYEHTLKGTFSPLVVETDNWFIKPIWQRTTSTITLTILTPSQALAYEYSRYLQAVFHINKYISFRDIPFFHNILIQDAQASLPVDVYNELSALASARLDITSNREILTFTDRQWAMYRMDSIDIQPENVPHEGDSIQWRLDVSFTILTQAIASYFLYLRHGGLVTLSSPFINPFNPPFLSVEDLTLNTIIYEEYGIFYCGGLTSGLNNIRYTPPLLFDLTHIDPNDFPLQFRIRIDKKYLRLYKRPVNKQIEPLFFNTIQYIITGNTAYEDDFNTFIQYNGSPVFIARAYNDQYVTICPNCVTLTGITDIGSHFEIEGQVETAGIYGFAFLS